MTTVFYDSSLLRGPHLVFTGQPIADCDGFRVVDADVRVHNPDASPVSWANRLRQDRAAAARVLRRSASGGDSFGQERANWPVEELDPTETITFIDRDGHECEMGVEELDGYLEPGWRLKCFAPRRDDTSPGAWLNRDPNGYLRVYDNRGVSYRYIDPERQWAEAIEGFAVIDDAANDCDSRAREVSGTDMSSNDPSRQRLEPFPFTAVKDGLNRPRQPEVIERLLQAGSEIVVSAQPNVGKTAIVTSMAVSIATGSAWCGRQVMQGSILYVAAEGGGGIYDRFHAAAKAAGVDPRTLPVYVVEVGMDLAREWPRLLLTAREVEATGQPLRLIVIDTLARCLVGDENASEVVGGYIKAVSKLREGTGAAILSIAHLGKDASKGTRGHSSLLGAVDTEMQLRREGEAVILKVTKQREGPVGEELSFKLTQVELDIDVDTLSRRSSVAAEVIERQQHEPGRRKRPGGGAGIVLSALMRLEEERLFLASDAEGVRLEDWRDAALADGLGDGTEPKSRVRAFQRAQTRLIDEGWVRAVAAGAYRHA